MLNRLFLTAALSCAALPAYAQDAAPADIAPEALNSLSTVHVLNAMPVFDVHGTPIGRVSGVTPRGNGMLWSVTILLEHGRQVNGQPSAGAATQTILARDASFDGHRVIATAPDYRG